MRCSGRVGVGAIADGTGLRTLLVCFGGTGAAAVCQPTESYSASLFFFFWAVLLSTLFLVFRFRDDGVTAEAESCSSCSSCEVGLGLGVMRRAADLVTTLFELSS